MLVFPPKKIVSSHNMEKHSLSSVGNQMNFMWNRRIDSECSDISLEFDLLVEISNYSNRYYLTEHMFNIYIHSTE